ncbi:2-C-methyl-D-erythritol 4-phosphate cytidylyltransferase [Alkalicella caledoniensis]|uniref:2-C-methyl-D-erythritol 4-phosphate cytidylyltransferase n=1 Tax=Alkalicella caledoniensis TaxID=2731377 RepID=A0A7G9W802_ALKCA|nr:2-C-methyl-D-erythritol 4-phosphate cytidylyltransferase [Alkalicella caledoniensis]QNO14814.1 2-C-methyl-D-erythritol 4-phosphate cytidylyltransferase [Alkalicella caledoniensis]
MKNIALIPAAGNGNRMGKKQKKQFLNLAGQPMLARTVLLFQNCDDIHEIILVVPKNDVSYCQEEIINKYQLDKVKKVVIGGSNRAQSVYNGIKEIKAGLEDVVLVHDAARPMLTHQLLKDLIKHLRTNPHSDGVIPVIPVKDTIKIIEAGKVVKTPLREKLFAVQTPQCFYINKLEAAFKKSIGSLEKFTDESSMMEYLGYSIETIKGEETNIKITTPQDLLLAQYILEREGLGDV